MKRILFFLFFASALFRANAALDSLPAKVVVEGHFYMQDPGKWLVVDTMPNEYWMKNMSLRKAGGKPLVIYPDRYYSFCTNERPLTIAKDPLHLGWYRINGLKIGGWLGSWAAQWVDGFVEGFEFDNRVFFERTFGVDPYSWGGSKRYEVVRDDFFKWDAYHQLDDARSHLYRNAGMMLGVGSFRINTKWWHYLIDSIVSWGGGFPKSRGMNAVRFNVWF